MNRFWLKSNTELEGGGGLMDMEKFLIIGGLQSRLFVFSKYDLLFYWEVLLGRKVFYFINFILL